MAVAVNEQFEHWLSDYGVSKMVQCDNGGAFCGVPTKLLYEEGLEIVHGWAKHPQSQVSVQHGNEVFKKKLTTWQERINTTDLVLSLPLLALAMNKQQHAALLNSICPYEVMFGHKLQLEHWVISYLCHMATIEQQSVLNFNSASVKQGHNVDVTDSSSDNSQGSEPTTHDLVYITDSDDSVDSNML